MRPAADRRSGVAALAFVVAALLLIVACGTSDPAVERSAPDDARDTTEPARLDGPRVGCPFGPFFPLSALDAPPPLIAASEVPDVADAIAPFLAGEEGAFWPQDGWRVLEVVDAERVLVVHPGSVDSEGVAFMTVSWTDGGWQWSGSSFPGGCVLVLEPEEDKGSVVEWRLDPTVTPPDADATTLVLEATERECASGRPMGDRLNEPEVTLTDEAVLILLTAQRLDGDQDCPGNPSQRVEIQLPEPLGQRELRDARSTDLGELSELLRELLGTG